jgi:hypothetical protein
MPPGTPTLIERREFKYLIDARTVAGIREAVRPFCSLDPYAAGSPTRRYTIDSLYLDTSGLSLFWANDHEKVDRFKLRIRTYPESPTSPVFFEVKRRFNDVISKSRGKVARDQWAALAADPAAPIPANVTGKDRMAVERFLALARSMHVRPFTIVRYQREAYVSRVDDYARVTFDTNIRAWATDKMSYEAPTRGWRALDDAVAQRGRGFASLTVLELKFTSAVPIWMSRMVERFGLHRGAFSKYGNSIRAYYVAGDARTARHAGGWR